MVSYDVLVHLVHYLHKLKILIRTVQTALISAITTSTFFDFFFYKREDFGQAREAIPPNFLYLIRRSLGQQPWHSADGTKLFQRVVQEI